MTGAGVLVVGYGNPLRGDDGIGWHAARRLADDPRLAGARVLACHQLAPELAEDVSQASLVVLVDASVDGAPGVGRSPLHPAPAGLAAVLVPSPGPRRPRRPRPRPVRPRAPIVLISVAGAAFADGDRLSPALQRVLPEVVDRVARVVEEHAYG